MAIRIEPGSEPIPGYKLIDRLGGGGFGEVWKAEAPGGLLKAIKFVYGDLQTEDEDGVRRAEQELKALKRVKTVRHPYLLSLERYDIIDSRLIIVMEMADKNLWERFRECRGQGLAGIPRDELLRYMEEAAEVLDLMNKDYQLQHLDIKPQNLFLVHNHVKVADFGLVKDLEGMSATVTGGVTPVYAAPETFDGVVSRFCDQYSLAIVYQELLTGQRPFAGTNVQQLIMQHLTGVPNLNPLPPHDREVIARGLAKKPEERHATCGDMARLLRSATLAAPAPRHVVEAPAPVAGRETEAPFTPGDGAAFPADTAEAPDAGRPAGLAPSKKEELAARFPSRARPAEPAAPRQEAISADAPPRPAPVISRPKPSNQGLQPAAKAAQTPTAPPEVTGDGFLFPALVVGLGGLGLEVVQRLRDILHERFGSLQALPHLHLLHIDTDPETTQEAAQGSLGTPWDPQEVVLARLNRPGHYMKPREGRMRVDSWLNFNMLYRIPRNPITTGVRALGRLALVDNYRLIAGRLKEDLEACLSPEALTAADRATRLGVRSNRPRVYVVASLAGGTGSGMFIDLAYILRNQLKQLGYAQPEVIGLFLLPPPERDNARPLSLGNSVAALIELNHFSAPDTTFSTRFDEREPTITDAAPPFQRTILLPLPEEASQTALSKIASLAGDFLFRELATPLGRTTDARRPVKNAGRSLTCQSFGLFHFSWPRRTMLQRSSRLLCQRLVELWVAPVTPMLKAAVQAWVVDQWAKQDLGPEPLIERLQQACARALGQAPEDLITAILSPLLPRGRKPPDVSAAAALDALSRLEEIVGRPDDTGARRSDPLAEALDKEAETLVKECSKKLEQLAVCLIEQPDYRLAGAEEAIRQMASGTEQMLEHHEPLCKELAGKAAEAHARIQSLLGQLQANPSGSRRAIVLSTDVLEVLRLYAKWRYQSLVLRRVSTIGVSLRGLLSEQAREVGYCRQRLVDLVKSLAEAAAAGRTNADSGPGRYLLPAGAKNLDAALQQLLESVAPEDMKAFDRHMQGMIQQQFMGLMHVCMSKSNLFNNLEVAMLQQSESFMAGRLGGSSLLEMFRTKYVEEPDAAQALADAYEAAGPDLALMSRCNEPEIEILAVPAGPEGEQLNELARSAVPDARFVRADSTDEIVLYREQPRLPLASLKLLGSPGRESYQQMTSSENFTPHSRTDIVEWLEVEAE